jgi:hypothetical protein
MTMPWDWAPRSDNNQSLYETRADAFDIRRQQLQALSMTAAVKLPAFVQRRYGM